MPFSVDCSGGPTINFNGLIKNFHSQHRGELLSCIYCYTCKIYNLYIYDKKIIDRKFTCTCNNSVNYELSKYSEEI